MYNTRTSDAMEKFEVNNQTVVFLNTASKLIKSTNFYQRAKVREYQKDLVSLEPKNL